MENGHWCLVGALEHDWSIFPYTVLGISSSHLTNSYFSEGLKPPTSFVSKTLLRTYGTLPKIVEHCRKLWNIAERCIKYHYFFSFWHGFTGLPNLEDTFSLSLWWGFMYQLNLKTGMFGSCSFASYEGAKKKPQTFSGIRPKRHQASFGHAVLVEPVTHMSGELSDGLPQNGNPVLLSNLRYPEVPSGVIKHGWLENPRTQWRLK